MILDSTFNSRPVSTIFSCIVLPFLFWKKKKYNAPTLDLIDPIALAYENFNSAGEMKRKNAGSSASMVFPGDNVIGPLKNIVYFACQNDARMRVGFPFLLVFLLFSCLLILYLLLLFVPFFLPVLTCLTFPFLSSLVPPF